MTAAEVADKLMSSEHADVVRQSVAWMAAELMKAEVAGQIGAELGEVSGERVNAAQWLSVAAVGHARWGD